MPFCTKAIISTEELYLAFLFKAPTSPIYHLRGILFDAAFYTLSTERTFVRKEKGGVFFSASPLAIFQFLRLSLEYFHAGLKASLKEYTYIQVPYNL